MAVAIKQHVQAGLDQRAGGLVGADGSLSVFVVNGDKAEQRPVRSLKRHKVRT